MKVIRLKTNPVLYSGNSYLVLGNWNKINDVNTLIDTGTDGYIIDHIENIHTGLGKNKVDQVILTHSHFDHAGGLGPIKEKYNPKVLAATNINFVDKLITKEETIIIGDSYFDVLFTPGHSSDSICLYSKSERVLFSGDLTLMAFMPDLNYTNEYVKSIEKLTKLKINVIYPGHGPPIVDGAEELIKNSYEVIKKSVLDSEEIKVYNN